MPGGTVITLRVITSLICIASASFYAVTKPRPSEPSAECPGQPRHAYSLRRLCCFKHRGFCLLFPLPTPETPQFACQVKDLATARCRPRQPTPRADGMSHDVTR